MHDKKPIVYQLSEFVGETGNGVNEYVYQTCNLLSDEIEFNFIYFDLTEKKISTEYLSNGFKIIHFPRIFAKGFLIPNLFNQWLDSISKNCIFHLHSVFRPLNFTVERLLKKKSIKFIYTPHDSYSKNSMVTKALLKKIFFALFDKNVLDNAYLVHAITSWGLSDLEKLTSNKIKLVTNFFKDNNYYQRLRYDDLKKQICYIGRLDIFQKGIDLQLEAYRLFKKDQKLKYIFIGNYNDRQLRDLEEILIEKKLELGSDIELTGLIPEDQKNQILSNSYVYMQLSRFEGFGLSIVEALSFGKPVIISENVPINKEIKKHGGGFVVSNPIEASDALNTLFNMSEKEYLAISKKARQCYLEAFHPDVAKPKLLEMYNYVLANQSMKSLSA